MRPRLTSFLLVLVSLSMLPAQNILKEPFDYPVSDSLDNMGGWKASGTSKGKVAVVKPGLTYAGYAGGGAGNAAFFSNVEGGNRYSRQLEKMDTGTVYVSYLLRVDSLAPTATSGFQLTMDQFGGTTNNCFRVYIQRQSNEEFRLGIAKTQGPVYAPQTYKVKNTLLIVAKYRFVAGAAKDTAALFVLSGGVPSAEPAKSDTIDVSGADAADIGDIYLDNSAVQTGLKGSLVTLDEIRVGRTWQQTVNEPANVFLAEDFLYQPNDTLRGKNGWDVYYGGVPMKVDTSGLSFSGHPGSGIGRALKIVGGSGSQALYRPFNWNASDSTIYLSAMVKFSGTNALPGFFLTLANAGSGNYRALVHARIDTGYVRFGLGATLASSAVFGTFAYPVSNTFVVVLKYRFVAGANNDQISLYTFLPGMPSSEPPFATVGPLTMPADSPIPASVALNSGAFPVTSPLMGATFLVDGIRVANNWGKGLTGVGPSAPKSVPDRFTLEQNFPNPFNPSTTVSYSLASAGAVTLKVYDMLGREVATLADGTQEAGVHTVPFNAERLSSGVYLYRLEAGGAALTRKMLLMK